MKNKLVVITAAISAVAMALGVAGCSAPSPQEAGKSEQAFADTSAEQTENTLVMTVNNRTNGATATFSAGYNDRGIVLTATVTDSDVYTGVYYSYGYDDNVEYLVNLKTSATGWDAAKTYHFLITADGDTFLQKANSPSGFGNSYALSLKCVNGGNFSYKAERTLGGYRTEVFLGYNLLETDKQTAYGNLCVCPAMRNTHDYADTVWAYYKENGCEWSNASSFIQVGINGYIV